MSGYDRRRKISVLLVENDQESREVRAQSICEAFPHYRVVTASGEADARECIQSGKFSFLLIDLLLRDGSSDSMSGEITWKDVRDPENGAAAAGRLLEQHREIHQEKPWSPWQLRPIIYSAARPVAAQENEIRVEVLCGGAYDFISQEPGAMTKVLASLRDMCELQEELQRLVRGKSWIGKVMNSLGCGIDIICTNWKIWYCSPRNAELSGLDPNVFHDRVCWREYHGFDGLFSPCPECPAAMTILSDRCGNPEARNHRCIVAKYPFVLTEHACAHPECLGTPSCPTAGRPLEGYSNCRLVPAKDGAPQWFYIMAAPIKSRDGARTIGAVETVVDLHRFYDGFLDSEQLAGSLSAEDRLQPVLSLVQWLGYNRARVFYLSADSREIIGLREIGNELRIKSFTEFRFPASETLIGESPQDAVEQRIVPGPGHRAHEFGKDKCRYYMEFLLRDPATKEILGTLAVDDVHDPEKGSTRTYSDDDLKKLRPLADCIAHVLSLRRKYRIESDRDRHDEAHRNLEQETRRLLLELNELVEQGTLTPKDLAIKLREFFREQLCVILQEEPDLCGFHLRFLLDDGLLRLYPGIGAYSRSSKTIAIAPKDPDSLSARCFDTRRIQKDIDAHHYPPFNAFKEDLEKEAPDAPGIAEAKDWCEKVKILGCFPIYLGMTGVGTLAIQSHAEDFFSTEAVEFLQAICNLIGRNLGPIIQERDYHDFWENAAYAFRGPASNLFDIAETLLMIETDPDKRAREEGMLALAEFLFTKADTFHFASLSTGRIEPTVKDEPLRHLWQMWCALFRGISRYGRKTIPDLKIEGPPEPALNDVVVETDRTLLTEIIYNVFENALKACHEQVRVDAALRDTQFLIDICDDGQGISDTAFRNMWGHYHEPFEVGALKGFGLGLKWSRRHAEVLRVSIEPSNTGLLRGAHFRITIPVKRRTP